MKIIKEGSGLVIEEEGPVVKEDFSGEAIFVVWMLNNCKDDLREESSKPVEHRGNIYGDHGGLGGLSCEWRGWELPGHCWSCEGFGFCSTRSLWEIINREVLVKLPDAIHHLTVNSEF